jgi:3-oxoadipate enol-lactonase
MPQVKIDDTLEIYYQDDNFTDPWKTSETVIFQHCNAGSSRMYYRWPPVLARHYRFIRLNRRGQGGSTVPLPGYPWSLSGAARDMVAFMDRLDIQKAHILGEATGSYVNLQFAYEYPERVLSLTLINLSPNLASQPRVAEFARQVKEEGVESWIRKSMDARFDPSQVDPEYLAWHTEEKIRQPHHATAEGLFYLATVDVTDILPQITVPTLVIAGERSLIHSEATSRQVKDLIPNCKLVVIPGVFGYVAHVAPEKCAETWLDFVRGL